MLTSLAIIACLSFATSNMKCSLRPESLRCEALVNPLAVNSLKPQFSWKLAAEDPNARGLTQSAYRVLVASSSELLGRDKADLWDSGWKRSGSQMHVQFGGKPLEPGKRYWWKVQIRDGSGDSSAWSPSAIFQVGLLSPSDWSQAQWIGDAVAREIGSKDYPPHNGWHTDITSDRAAQAWCAIDLGKVQSVDGVTLYPARPFDWQPDTPGFLFPVRYKLEVAQSADFSDAKVVVDRTSADQDNPGAKPVQLTFPSTEARFVRLTGTVLDARKAGEFGMALCEMQVLSGQTVLSVGASASASSSLEGGSWGIKKLTDGTLLPSRGGAPQLPATMVRKEFSLDSDPVRATLYVTAKGLYEARLNGSKVGTQELAPEWTEYDRRIQYQAYDVTSMLKPGANAIGAMLADGWYAGRLMTAPKGMRNGYGAFPELLCMLVVQTKSGQLLKVTSDASWLSTMNGPIRAADIYDGETYDATKEMDGWDLPGFDSQGWKPASPAAPDPKVEIVPQPDQPIRIERILHPKAITEPQPGLFVVDLGQNFAGWIRIVLRGSAGQTVTMKYGEALLEDGTLYTTNLRSAKQTDTVTLRNYVPFNYSPRFTYHGFRYVQIEGLSQKPTADDIVGCAVHTSSPMGYHLETDDAEMNRLMQNVEWTMRSNLIGVPTDCPQRDERLGWMGDILVFGQTSMYLADMEAFYTKWLADVRDAQTTDGRFADFSPQHFVGSDHFTGALGWSDAAVFCAWEAYVHYGDKRILEAMFEPAKKWLSYLESKNPDLLVRNGDGNRYGDWLNSDTLVLEGMPKTGGAMPIDAYGTAFFARSAQIVNWMAEVLGKKQDAKALADLSNRIVGAYQKEFVQPDGTIKGDTQAGYALSLAFDLLTPEQRNQAMVHLRAAMDKVGGRLTTGFHSTHRLMELLSADESTHPFAVALTNRTEMPSWRYMMRMGATTMWERWDGFVKGRGTTYIDQFQNPGMNSFNHWAFGAIGEWMIRHWAGIAPDSAKPAYEEFDLYPKMRVGPAYVKSSIETSRGPIKVEWRRTGDRFELNVQVPPNSTARLRLPAAALAIMESGKPMASSKGVSQIQALPTGLKCRLQSGHYVFTGPLAPISATAVGAASYLKSGKK